MNVFVAVVGASLGADILQPLQPPGIAPRHQLQACGSVAAPYVTRPAAFDQGGR